MKARLKNIVMNFRWSRALATPIWHFYRRLTIGYLKVADLPGRIHYNDIFDINNLEHYKSVSTGALFNIEDSLNLVSQRWQDIDKCLNFACGYGRELRLIATRLVPGKITCCDINKRAVDFCSLEFGANPLLSSDSFETLHFPHQYTLIWCGSLFTHLPEKRFREAFKLLASALEPEGLLIFTTHEKESLNRLEHYEAPMPSKEVLEEMFYKGEFTFTPYLWTSDYGISISPKNYVLKLNETLNKPLKLIRYKEMGWDNHQSVLTFQRL
jgi:SAM-dependent methyltransferase